VIQQRIINNGLLSVGNPLGTGLESFTLKNGYEGTGTLQFNLDNQGHNSALVLDGGIIDVRQANLEITSTTFIDALNTYELMRIQGAPLNSIQGPFLTIPQRIGKFIPEIAYNPNNVVLSFDLVPTSFAASQPDSNNGHVANYLNQLSGIVEGLLEKFIFEIESLSEAQQEEVFNQISTAAQGSMVQSVTFGSSVNTTVQERMNNVFTDAQPQGIPVSTVAFSPTTNKIPSLFKPSFVTNQGKDPSLSDTLASLFQDRTYQLPFTKGRSTAWAQGFTLNRLQKTDQDIPGFNADSEGLMVGVDSPILRSNVYVGASVGFGRAGINFKQGRGSSNIRSYLASIYTMYSTKDFYVAGSFSGSYNKYHNNRQIPYLNLTAQSDYHGTEWTPHLGAGVNFKFKEASVQPFVNIDYLTLHQGAYQENDASFANLYLLSSSSSQLKSEAGFNVTKSFTAEKGTWTGLFKLSYIRTQPLKKSKLIAGFVGQPLTFETDNFNVKQNKVSPGVGIKYSLKNGLYLNARYDAELAKKSVSQSVSLRLGYVF
jgi:outer membrane autotransporter protein